MDITGLSFEDEGGYQRFADLAAHELFHAWNVKRIRDTVLGPFDYTRENYTRLLWFHEGFTDYLANVIILRAGHHRREALLALDRRGLAEVREPARAQRDAAGRAVVRSLDQALQAGREPRQPRVSYYEKGLWAGMALDLILRGAAAGGAGCPICFARLWTGFGAHEPPDHRARHPQRRRAASRGRVDGRLLPRYIHGKDELPLLALLRTAGLWSRSARSGSSRRGSPRPIAIACASAGCAPGRASRCTRTALLIRNVVPGSPAWRRADLQRRDRRRRRPPRHRGDLRPARGRPRPGRPLPHLVTSAATSCTRRR